MDVWDSLEDHKEIPVELPKPKKKYPHRKPNPNRKATLIINCPSYRVGRIIGREGITIKRIKLESYTDIFVENLGYEAKIHIYGTPEAAERARSLLEPLIREVRRSPSPKIGSLRINELGDEGSEWQLGNDNTRLNRIIPIIKDIYFEHQCVTTMSSVEAYNWRHKYNNISIIEIEMMECASNYVLPNPIIKFEYAFERYPDLMEEIKKQDFSFPMPIQAQAWPIVLSGRDLISIAPIGSGKTLTYLFSALLHIVAQPKPIYRGKGVTPNVLIFVPTTEHISELEKELKKYHFRGISTIYLYDEDPANPTNTTFEAVQIIVTTPNRFNTVMEREFIDMEAVTYLVFDDVDKLLDMNFEPLIENYITSIRSDRQTILTSTIWKPEIERLINTYLKNAVQITVDTLDLSVVHTVTEIIYVLNEEEKFEKLVTFLKNFKTSEKIIVFCGTKTNTVNVATDLGIRYFPLRSIYGGLDQSVREESIREFQTGEINILVAADIMSCGLNVNSVSHVLNYDFPRNMEEYIRRARRTGRDGNEGVVISYMTRNDKAHAEELIKILKEANQHIPRELEILAEFDKFEEPKRNTRVKRYSRLY